MKSIKKYIIFVLFIFLPVFLLGCTTNKINYFEIKESEEIQKLSSYSDSFAEIVSPAIVGIECVRGNSSNIGSGVCVKSGGYVLTNYHVISNKGEINLYLHNNKKCRAICVYENPDMDIAVLKANYAIPFLKLSDSSLLKVGQTVFAVGTPLNLNFQHTFTKGIVSALNRKINVALTNSDVNVMENLIQHDASINSGNSGGPLLNELGEVVGINTLKITNAEGMGFAIPSQTFEKILEEI